MNKYPKLRTHVRKGANGQRWVSYYYDMRGTGEKDIPLGKDYAKALEQWDKIHNQKPLTQGRIQEAFDKWKADCLPLYTVKGTRDVYKTNLKYLEPVFGQAGWHEVTLPVICQYLDKRTAKTQGNREMSVLSIVWNKARKWGMTNLPFPGFGVKGWKNPEKKRKKEVRDVVFDAIYAHASRVLKDSMDIATATGMRITDVRTILMPVDGQIQLRASKTAKGAVFTVSESPVLTAVVKRREAMKAHSVMLLCTDSGRQISEKALWHHWDRARKAAAEANPLLAEEILSIYNRDMRKRAADLSNDLESASKLLQHSNPKVTEDHYRTKPVKLKAVR